jgi:hypothetical protein
LALTFPGACAQVKAELTGCTNGGPAAPAAERRRELIFRNRLGLNAAMSESRPKTKRKPARDGIADPQVAAVFAGYPRRVQAKLLALRRLILETAAKTPGVGALDETLKWGQPSYLTKQTRSGSTIRIDRVKPEAGDDTERYALYVHCQTTLVSTFRQLYRDELSFGGNRSILLDADQPLPKAALRHCIALALTYHRNAAKDYL